MGLIAFDLLYDRLSAEERRAIVEQAAAFPAFIGSSWFQWVDQPSTGRMDGENYNIGFIKRDLNVPFFALRYISAKARGGSRFRLDGRPDAGKLDLIGRMGGSSYTRTRERFDVERPD